jgi:hypothetical protein
MTTRTSKDNQICLKFLGGGLVCQLPTEHSGECNPSINCNLKLEDSILTLSNKCEDKPQ